MLSLQLFSLFSNTLQLLTQFWSLLKFTSSESLSLDILSNTAHSFHFILFFFFSIHLSLLDTLYYHLPSLKQIPRGQGLYLVHWCLPQSQAHNGHSINVCSVEKLKGIIDVVTSKLASSRGSYITFKTKYSVGIHYSFLLLRYNSHNIKCIFKIYVNGFNYNHHHYLSLEHFQHKGYALHIFLWPQ